MLDQQTIDSLIALIDSQGEPIVFVDTQHSGDTEEFDVADGADIPTPGQAYVGPVDRRRLDDTAIVASDKGAYIYAPNAPSTFNDEFQITVGGVLHTIIDLRTYKSGGADVLHELVIRA